MLNITGCISGGVVWEGSIVLCEVLKQCDAEECALIELGCGAGLCGIMSTCLGMNSVVTDREIDLAEQNLLCNVPLNAVPSGGVINAIWYDWEEDTPDLLCPNSRESKRYRLIVGVEVACLLKQQEHLVRAICDLSDADSIVMITFDDGSSKYEAVFRERMKDKGFLTKPVLSASIIFEDEAPLQLDQELLQNLLPPAPGLRRTYGIFTRAEMATTHTEKLNCCASHKVVLFYRQSAVRTCCNCNSQYFPALNNCSACRTHRGYYVCRKHPAEIRLNIAGHGDGLGYYGNGNEGNIDKMSVFL